MPSCLAAAHSLDERFSETAAGTDAELAVQLYEKACLGGELEGCQAVLRGILQGPSREKPELPQPRAVDRAPERRRALLAKACTLGDGPLCSEAGDAHLGFDRTKAEQLGRQGCALQHGDRVERESCETEAAALAERAEKGATDCEAANPGGCLALGNAIAHADRIGAREAYDKECRRRRLVVDNKTDSCVAVYEKAFTSRRLPAAEPSIADQPNARVILRSLTIEPSRPERPTAEQIRERVEEGTTGLAACYASALGRNPKLTGALELHFTIDGLGEPFDVRDHELALVDVQAVECIKQRARAWRFPEPKQDTVRVEASFAFRIEEP